jgi:hypothetical protein
MDGWMDGWMDIAFFIPFFLERGIIFFRNSNEFDKNIAGCQ